MIRTVVHPLDSNSPLLKLPNHPRRQCQKLGFAVVAAGNAGLVGYHHQEIIEPLRVAAKFKDTLLEMEHVRSMDICVLEIDPSVSIQEEGLVFSDRHTRSSQNVAATGGSLVRRNRAANGIGLSNSKRLLDGIAKRMPG